MASNFDDTVVDMVHPKRVRIPKEGEDGADLETLDMLIHQEVIVKKVSLLARNHDSTVCLWSITVFHVA